jgi:hypothetical protein
MYYTAADYLKRGTVVFIAVALIVIASFSFMFWMKQTSIQMVAKYPQVDCTIINHSYYTDANGYTLLKSAAEKEFKGYYNATEGSEKTQFQGAL